MKDYKFRSAFGYDTAAASDAAGSFNDQPSMTVQSMADDADLSKVLERHGIGAVQLAVRLPTYGDFTGISDFRSALDAVRHGEEEFMKLPAKLRLEFDNDPQRFLEFVSKEESLPRMRELGLLREEIAPPPATPVATPPAVAPSAPVKG